MYGTVNGADEYLGSRISGASWLNQPEATKLMYLTSAHDVIESVEYSGDKTDPTQTDQFPRDEATTVPDAVIYAEYQLALCMMLQGYAPGEASAMRLKRSKTGPIETEFFEGVSPLTLEGLYCPRAWTLLKPFFSDPDELTLVRVS